MSLSDLVLLSCKSTQYHIHVYIYAEHSSLVLFRLSKHMVSINKLCLLLICERAQLEPEAVEFPLLFLMPPNLSYYYCC